MILTRARAHPRIVILIITGISINIDVNIVATILYDHGSNISPLRYHQYGHRQRIIVLAVVPVADGLQPPALFIIIGAQLNCNVRQQPRVRLLIIRVHQSQQVAKLSWFCAPSNKCQTCG